MSYSRTDRPVVRRIQRFIESYRPPNRSRRLRLYLDETDMRGGSLPDNLSQALAESRALVVCWSDHAAVSRWVKTEIEEFRGLGRERQIGVVHVGGKGPTVDDEAFAGVEPLEHDLRKAWRAGILRPGGKLELLRLIAFLTDVDMRALRNWARRRAIRNAFIAMGVMVLPAAGIMSLPMPTWDPVPLAHPDKQIIPLACEVTGDSLWVAAWSMPAGGVSGKNEYFEAYPDVLNDPEHVIYRPAFSLARPMRF